jgi:hypothetical protein
VNAYDLTNLHPTTPTPSHAHEPSHRAYPSGPTRYALADLGEMERDWHRPFGRVPSHYGDLGY